MREMVLKGVVGGRLGLDWAGNGGFLPLPPLVEGIMEMKYHVGTIGTGGFLLEGCDCRINSVPIRIKLHISFAFPPQNTRMASMTVVLC